MLSEAENIDLHPVVQQVPVIDESRPCFYRAIDWGEFRGKRSDGDHADCGAEVQISR